MTYIDPLLAYLHHLPEFLIYIFLGLGSFMENLFPPFPGDLVTVFGAFLIGAGRLTFFGVYVSTTFGSFLGFITLFRLGGWLGRRYFFRHDYRFFKKDNILKAEAWFKKYGYFIVLINRFLPGIRSVISITGGISGLNTPWVIILSFVSCALWNIIWIALGYALGNNWDTVKAEIASLFARYNLILFILFIVFVLFLIVKKRIRG